MWVYNQVKIYSEGSLIDDVEHSSAHIAAARAMAISCPLMTF